jgi:hypothetical protein
MVELDVIPIAIGVEQTKDSAFLDNRERLLVVVRSEEHRGGDGSRNGSLLGGQWRSSQQQKHNEVVTTMSRQSPDRHFDHPSPLSLGSA